MSTNHVYEYPTVHGGQWRQVLTKFALLPFSSITVTSSGSDFHWRILGAGPPFSIIGGPQKTLNSPVGSFGAYVEVQVKPTYTTSITVVARDML